MATMTKLTEDTLIPIGLAASALLSFAGAVWWASAVYVRIGTAENNISSLQASQDAIVKELREVNGTLIEIRTVLKRNK